MKTEIYRGYFYLVETEIGTELVPETCVFIPQLPITEPVLLDRDADTAEEYDRLAESLVAFTEGKDVYDIHVVKGYYGRRTMPGYMDCTDWHWAGSENDLRAELEDMYGEED